MFSCRTRGFCPSCHAKRLEEWGEWMWETLLLDVPHRQVVFTIPKMLRLFFKFKRKLLFYFQAAAGKTLEPGVVAAIQTFGDRINFHPHLHFLVTEGGVDEAGGFQRIGSFDDDRLAELFAREVLRLLVGRELLSPDWAERLLSWRHSGFLVHSRVRAKTKPEAERVGKYANRAVLSLEKLSFKEPEGAGVRRFSARAGRCSVPIRVSDVLFSRISQELTRPTDREYTSRVVKGGDSAVGAKTRGGPGKENS